MKKEEKKRANQGKLLAEAHTRNTVFFMPIIYALIVMLTILNDNYSRLKSEGYEVIGVSPDTVDKQNKFAGKFGFKYNLLADDSKELIKAFGVWGKKKFRGNEYEGVLRTTFIIDIL
mgnify:CR=1 FL=1